MTHSNLPPIKPLLNTRGFYIEHGSASKPQRSDFVITEGRPHRMTWGYSSYILNHEQKKIPTMLWPSVVPGSWARERFRARPLGSYLDKHIPWPIVSSDSHSPLMARTLFESMMESFFEEDIIKVLMEPDDFENRVVGDWQEGLSGGYEFDLRFGEWDGRHVIQQIGIQGCTAAATAMLILDHGGTVNLRALFERGSAQTEAKLRDLTCASLRAAKTTLKGRVARAVMPRLIERYGPVIASLNLRMGKHCVVVDAISDTEVVLRDPFHGWMIAVKAKAFWRSFTGEVVFVEA